MSDNDQATLNLIRRVEELEKFQETVLRLFPEIKLLGEQMTLEAQPMSKELMAEINAPLNSRPRDPAPGEE